MNAVGRCQRPRRGAHAIEFAILMPLFILTMTGCMEYAWVMYHRSALASAVDVGCRRASLVDPGLKEVNMGSVFSTATTVMVSQFDNQGPGCKGSCATTVSAVGSMPARSVHCRLEIAYTPITRLIPAPAMLASQAVIRLEFQRNP